MGGLSSGTQRFCNKKCLGNAYVISAAQKVSPDVIDRQVEEIFRGNCPKCRGLGPIDVHKVHRVWSALVLTRWTTTPQVSCRSCATKSQLGGVLFSLFCGWWGFPWGLILTPVQITRNIAGMYKGPDPSKPSDTLRKLVLVNIGAQALQKSQQNNPPSLVK
jgi:hypothetical protein